VATISGTGKASDNRGSDRSDHGAPVVNKPKPGESTEDAEPGDGFFTDYWRDPFPREEYAARLAKLLAEDWSDVSVPSLAEMTDLYQEALARTREFRRNRHNGNGGSDNENDDA
jgi:hypothetical protein